MHHDLDQTSTDAESQTNQTLNSEPTNPARRDVLRGMFGLAAGAGATGLTGCSGSSRATPATAGGSRNAHGARQATRVARIAHLTDIHVQPETNAPKGFAQALDHMMSLRDRPTVMLTGGDLVMDSFGQPQARTRTQWDIFTKTLRDHTQASRIPTHHCMGNHDIWGWDKDKSKTTGTEEHWGKRWIVDELGMPGTAYATMIGSGTDAWKLITLDSVQPKDEGGYVGGLGEPQFEWLKGELAGTPRSTNVLLLSHIPIIHCSGMLSDGDHSKNGWKLSAGEVCGDGTQIVALLRRHPNVKLALSGHIHTVERVNFQGVSYVNNGAVSGNWWRSQKSALAKRDADTPEALTLGPLRCTHGYGVIDLYADGSVQQEYVEFGWEPGQG